MKCNICHKAVICLSEDVPILEKEGCWGGGELQPIPKADGTVGNLRDITVSMLEDANQTFFAEALPDMLETVPEEGRKNFCL